ncbi:uncharacterized protein JCM15063_006345 [Sporobolomyces koalae]|uniref:uncharacterized protein n=1 Tax=Sporobolomyces koalae TaxID=500713 RepID=UPI00317D74C0
MDARQMPSAVRDAIQGASRRDSSALLRHMSNFGPPSHYSLRTASNIRSVNATLNAYALDNQRPYHVLFELADEAYKAVIHPSFSLSQYQSAPSSFTTADQHSSSRGKPCGHVFRAGESVYRCRTCGLDSTCVLCSSCFHASPEHRNQRHDVTVSVHSGVGAGCCDCGDDEAWKEGKQRECKIHRALDPNAKEDKGKARETEESRRLDELKEQAKRDVRELVRACLEWAVQQFESSPRDVIAPESVADFARPPPSQQPSNPQHSSDDDTLDQVSWSVSAPRLQAASVPPSATPWTAEARVPRPLFSSGPFAVVLWNDEKHSFPQVIEIVSRAIGCSRAASAAVAQRVDTVGRDVILITPNSQEALRASKTIASIDLGIDVRDAQRVFDECLAGEIIQWLKDLSKVRLAGEENAFAEIVAEAWLEDGRFMRLAKVEERLWKEVRKAIQEISVGIMSVSGEIKHQLSIQYASVYPDLCNSYLLTDREPENSLIFLSVQIFTVPSICATLVQAPHNFFFTMIDILYAFFTEQTDPPRAPPLPTTSPSTAARLKSRRLILPPDTSVTAIDPEAGSSFKQKRYFQLFSDLNHLLSSQHVQRVIVNDHKYLAKLVPFLTLFEGMNPLTRAVGHHVEYESDSWVSAFNVTIQLGKLCRSFGEAYRTQANSKELAIGLQYLISWLHVQPPMRQCTRHEIELGIDEARKSYPSIDFHVADAKNSFHHPLIWLWAEMAKNVELLDRDVLAQLGAPGGLRDLIASQESLDEGYIFLPIMEQPLRVVALVAQIRAGLWVRNGFGIRAQQLHYKEYSLRENTYDQDLFFLQNGLVILDPSHVFAAILDRFDLKSWLIDGQDELGTYEPVQAMSMTEELLSVLIALVSDPTFMKPLSDHEALQRELVHHLALGPCVYSDIHRRISDRFADDNSMDSSLAQIAHFKPPTGTTDQGVYTLRDEFYDKVDPYFARYTRNQREEVEKIVRDHMKKHRPSTEAVIVPTPLEIEKGSFVELARALASPVLHQLIYCSLKHGRKRGELFSEIVVDQALHLAMLAFTNPVSHAIFVEFATLQATSEHSSARDEINEDREADEYVPAAAIAEDESTLVRLLVKIEEDERMKAVHHKATWLLDQLQTILGDQVTKWRRKTSLLSQEEELKRKNDEKRLAAKARQEAIMKQFAQAQSAFLESVEDDDDEDDDEYYSEDDQLEDGETHMGDAGPVPKPRIDFGSCIVCQDALEGSQAFGILALVQASRHLRLTPFADDDALPFQHEIVNTPPSLDQDASPIRPFGIASEKTPVHSFDESGDGIARGFPQRTRSGFHVSSCGHLMHLACFDTYCASIATRHRQQPTRCHPETIERREFVCPLCKSLGNVLLPAGSDSPAFQPFEPAFRPPPFASWAQPSVSPTLEEATVIPQETLQRVSQLSLINEVDHACYFEPFKISLALPAVRAERYGDREGLMIARLLQVTTALRSETAASSGCITTLSQDVIGYTVSVMEVASRGTSDPAWKVGDANLRLLQSLFSTMQHLSQALLPSLEEASLVVATSIRQRLGGLFSSGSAFEQVPVNQISTLALVAETAACVPSMFRQVVVVTFYTHLLQSLFRLVKSFRATPSIVDWQGDPTSNEATLYLSLAKIRQICPGIQNLVESKSSSFDLTFGKHLHSQMLPFLRRCAILQRVVFGEPTRTSTDASTFELERLMTILDIPSIASVLDEEPASANSMNEILRAHLSTCADACTVCGYIAKDEGQMVNAWFKGIEHPVIYELLGLPQHLDTLVASALNRKCRRCQQSPENPAICLLCGQLVCCQSFCCMAGEEEAQHGECNEHMWTCGGSVGIFFLVKRNVILYLHTDKGAFTQPPYLDSHGEVDNGRTRSRSMFPQYLHQGRYDEVRKVWLNQGVATLVARKLEATTDHGGWTTM